MVDISNPDVVQTQKLCLLAVNEDGLSLQYVKNQTEDMCIEAVKENGLTLFFVKKQTEKICICAVKQAGCALKYVKNQTDAICICAVRQQGRSNFREIYNTIKYPSPQLITELLKLYPSQAGTIMTTYATDIMKTYKACSDAIVTSIVRHANDLLYRPNNVNALVSHKKWHTTSSIAKTVFLMA